MNSPSDSSDDSLPLDIHAKIGDLRERFEKCCQQEQAPAIDEYLLEVDAAQRDVLFGELLRLEIDYTVMKGREFRPDEHITRFPQFRKTIERVVREARTAALNKERLALPVNLPRFGPYEANRELGRGGFGVVYLATHDETGHQVAIKVGSQSLHEAKTLLSLKHPSIIRVLHVGRDTGDRTYVVMDYMEGGSLRDRIEPDHPMLPEEAISIASRIAEALHAAHTHPERIYHRDLKPENVLFDADGIVCVADFGLALTESQLIAHRGDLSGTPLYQAPEQIRGEANWIDARTDVWALGVVLYEMLTARRPFSGPDLREQIKSKSPKALRQFNDRVPETLEEICLKCLEKDPGHRYQSADSLARALRGQELGVNPYKGLESFEEADADRFFGRGDQVKRLRDEFVRLFEESMSVPAKPRLLPILGPSGCGKSSLAKAGLVPELRKVKLPNRKGLRVAIFRPRMRPLKSLADVLDQLSGASEEAGVSRSRKYVGNLQQSNDRGEYDGLWWIVDSLRDISNMPLVVVVDQAEEVFTECEDVTERDQFIENLLYAASQKDGAFSLVLTLRSDFLAETQQHEVLNSIIAEQGVLIPTMTEVDLREAIVRPARNAGYEFDEAVVNLLVKDSSNREGALPLLQVALSRIWDGLRNGAKPAETYRQLGGVGGALAQAADAVFERLSEEEQQIARRIFLGLVTLGEGTCDTRRIAAVSQILSHKDDPYVARKVLRRFSAKDTRFITLKQAKQDWIVAPQARKGTDSELVFTEQGPISHRKAPEFQTPESVTLAELTHEALLEHWHRLRSWLDASRSDLRFRERLDDAARRWHELGRPDGSLWRPPELDLLRQCRPRLENDWNTLQKEFADSAERYDKVLAAAERAQQQRQEAEREREAERRCRELRRLRVYAGVFTILVVGLAIAGVQILRQNRELGTRLRTETARRLAKASVAARDEFPIRSVLLAIESVRVPREHDKRILPVAHEALLNSVAALDVGGRPVYGPEGIMPTAAVGSSGRWLVTANETAGRLWDLEAEDLVGSPLLLGDLKYHRPIAIGPNGRWLVTIDGRRSRLRDRSLRHFVEVDAAEDRNPHVAEGGLHYVDTVSDEAVDDRSIYVTNDTLLWDLHSAKSETTKFALHGHEQRIASAVISPDARWLVTQSPDTIRLWDLSTEVPTEASHRLWSRAPPITGLVTSPDGRWLVAGGAYEELWVWDLDQNDPSLAPTRLERVNAAKARKYVASFDFTDRKTSRSRIGAMGPITNLRDVYVFGESIPPLPICISSDGRWLVAGSVMHSQRGKAQFWDLRAGRPSTARRMPHEPDITIDSLSISSNARRLIVGGQRRVDGEWEATTQLWDLASKDNDSSFSISAEIVAISPNGHWLVTKERKAKEVSVWDLTAEGPFEPEWVFGKHGNAVQVVAITPDSRKLIMANDDGPVQLWDLRIERPYPSVKVRLEGEDPVRMVAVSANSRWLVTITDREAERWDLLDAVGPTRSIISCDGRSIAELAVSSDGRWLAAVNSDGAIRLLDFQKYEPRSSLVLRDPDHPVTESSAHVAIGPYSHWLVTAIGNDARLWNLAAEDPTQTGRELWGHQYPIDAVKIVSKGRRLVTQSVDSLRHWDLTAENPDKTSQVLMEYQEGLESICIGPGGRWLAIETRDDFTRLCDLRSDSPAASMKLAASAPRGYFVLGPNHPWYLEMRRNTARLSKIGEGSPPASPIVLRGHAEDIVFAGLSQDGRWLTTCSRDATHLWDLADERPDTASITFSWLGGSVGDASFGICRHGRWLVMDNAIRPDVLCDLGAKRTVASYLRTWRHDRIVSPSEYPLPWTPEPAEGVSAPQHPKKAMAEPSDVEQTVNEDDLPADWDDPKPISDEPPANWDEPMVIRQSASKPSSGGYSMTRGGQRLVRCRVGEVPHVWDLSAADPAASPILSPHVRSFAFSPDGRSLATQLVDGRVEMWDLQSENPSVSRVCQISDEQPAGVRVYALYPIPWADEHARWVNAMISPDKRWLFSACTDAASLWDLQDDDPISAPETLPHEQPIAHAAFGPNGRWLVTASEGNARLWNLHAEKPSASPIDLRGHENEITSLAISPNGHWLTTGSSDTTARLWPLDGQNPADSGLVLRGHRSGFMSVAFSPDSHWFVTGDSDGTVRLWDLRDEIPADTDFMLRGLQEEVTSLVMSPDGRWLAAGSFNTTRLWSLTDENPNASSRSLRGRVMASAHTRYLVTVDKDTIRVWDFSTDDPARSPVVLSGHEDTILSVASSVDGCWLVSGSKDGTARLWDLRPTNGKQIGANPIDTSVVLRWHAGPVHSVEIGPKGRWFITASGGTTHLWDLDVDRLLARAHRVAGREFTADERRHHVSMGAHE